MTTKKECLVKVHVRIKAWSKGNWGFPFIAGFLVLLFSAAVFLAAGSAFLAEEIADWAYFTLVAGVILQLACLSRNKKMELL